MRSKLLYKNRYPGLTPFDKGQSTIFFGRDQETKELFYQICLEKIVVLFSKSGLGKSSLLNAGVSPQLEANGYIPIRVRFSSYNDSEDKNENILLRDFRLLLKYDTLKDKILYNKEYPRLWEYVKATVFNELISNEIYLEQKKDSANKSNVTSANELNTKTTEAIPVFIFDQFEEFFNHPVLHQQEFLRQLAEIVHQETPYRILDWITDKDPEKRTYDQVKWSEQPKVKVVFALRSERFSEMQSLVPYLPTVLRNRYELKPLNPVQAEAAIKGPAEKDLGLEYTPKFSFEPLTFAEIIKVLKEESEEIESSQLQIICNYIEEKVRVDLVNKQSNFVIVVDHKIIDPKNDFPKILDNFYESQLNKIEDPNNREIARKLIEDELVLNGAREGISKNRLINDYNVNEDLIEEIQNTRLIREEMTSRGSIYELSHDTLIAPVEKSKVERLEAENRQKKEAERTALAEEAEKNKIALEERSEQLIKEMKLKGKIKLMGGWIFILVIIVAITVIVMLKNQNTRHIKEIISSMELKEKVNKTIGGQINNYQEKNHEVSDSVKNIVLELIDSAEKVSEPSKSKDTTINKIIDQVFKKELQNKIPNSEKLTTTEKIKHLRKMNPYTKK